MTSQSRTPLVLELEGMPALIVTRVRGREALHRLPRFRVEIEAALEDDVVLVGKRGRLRLFSGAFGRSWSVEVRRSYRQERARSTGRAHATLDVAHPASRLRHRRSRRIFQGKTSAEIAALVLGEHGIAIRDAMLAPLPWREVCLQYDEDDLTFLLRVLAEEGIALVTEAGDAEAPLDAIDTLVLIDHPSRHPEVSGPPFEIVGGAPGDAMVREEHHGRAAREIGRAVPASVLRRSYDAMRPNDPAEERCAADGAPATSEVFEADGVYGEVQVRPLLAARALDQFQRDSAGLELTATSTRLAPGYVVRVDDGRGPRRLIVDEARLRGRQAVSDGSEPLEVRALMRDAARAVRPPRPKRRIQQVLETATVVGPPGEEIYTDSLGRIRARFHWDRSGSDDEAASCWIRVTQVWSGSGWGAQFVPRVGMEILVGFLDGDPDRPVVLGCLPNATHRPPIDLPGGSTKSGIVTRTTPGGTAGNAIVFDDASGSESLLFHARKDLDVRAEDGSTVQIGGSSAIAIGGDHQASVSGDAAVRVSGETKIELGSDGSLGVAGSVASAVSGDLRMRVAGSSEATISGSEAREVLGDATHRVTGPWTLRADSILQIAVGSDENPGHADLQVQGTASVSADGAIAFRSATQITLAVGDSRVEIGPSAIRLVAPHVALEASETLTLRANGPTLTLDDQAELLTNSLYIYSKGARLELDEEARLIGKRVLLNCKPKDPSRAEDGAELETRRLSVRFSDEQFEPYAGKRYQVRVGDYAIDGTTGDDGGLRARIPRDARTATVRMWTATYPDGPTKDFTLVIEPLPAATTVSGLKARLKNLGYYQGATDSEDLDDATREAVRDFQSDHDLPMTGEPDESTMSTVVRRHGS